MKTRPLFILAAMLVVLVGLKFWQSSKHDERLTRSGLEELFPAVAASEIGGFTVTGPAGTEIALERDGESWRVASSYGHRAAGDRVEQMLDELSGLRGEYRSEREAVLADYSLDDSRALHLRVFDLSGAELGHLLLGDRMTGVAGFFARRNGEDTAFAARGNLLGSLGIYGDEREPKARNFLDLKAFEVDRQEVDRIRIITNGGELELAKRFEAPAADSVVVDRSSYEWQVAGVPLDRAKTDGVLGALTSVHARDLLDPAGDYGFTAAARRAELHLADGSSRVVEFGAKVEAPEAGVAMRVYGDEAVYLVYDRLPDRIFKSREELLPESP